MLLLSSIYIGIFCLQNTRHSTCHVIWSNGACFVRYIYQIFCISIDISHDIINCNVVCATFIENIFIVTKNLLYRYHHHHLYNVMSCRWRLSLQLKTTKKKPTNFIIIINVSILSDHEHKNKMFSFINMKYILHIAQRMIKFSYLQCLVLFSVAKKK